MTFLYDGYGSKSKVFVKILIPKLEMLTWRIDSNIYICKLSLFCVTCPREHVDVAAWKNYKRGTVGLFK